MDPFADLELFLNETQSMPSFYMHVPLEHSTPKSSMHESKIGGDDEMNITPRKKTNFVRTVVEKKKKTVGQIETTIHSKRNLVQTSAEEKRDGQMKGTAQPKRKLKCVRPVQKRTTPAAKEPKFCIFILPAIKRKAPKKDIESEPKRKKSRK